jgi:putative DNA primase/helicase
VTPTLSGFSTHFGAASLIGKSCAIFTDARISNRSDVSMGVERILAITGEDPQTIPRKNREDWNGRLRTRFTLISNELPRLTDMSGALPSRMIVLRFTRSFLGREDKDLERKLKAELPGILNWAIAGWRRLRDRGRFVQPQSAVDLVEQMENLSSPVGEFVKDCCVVGAAHEIITHDLYEGWKRWCQRHGLDHAGSAPIFGRNLCAAFPTVRTSTPTTRGRARNVRLYLGIDFSPQEKARQQEEEAEMVASF